MAEEISRSEEGVRQRLSKASAAFDQGSKKCRIDPIEQRIRSYDKNNDGKIGIDEACQMMKDLQNNETEKNEAIISTLKENQKKTFYERATSGLLIFAMVLIIGVPTVTFAAVHSAKTVVTANTGHMVEVTLDEDIGRRLVTRRLRSSFGRKLSEREHVGSTPRSEVENAERLWEESGIAPVIDMKMQHDQEVIGTMDLTAYSKVKSNGWVNLTNIRLSYDASINHVVTCNESSERCDIYSVLDEDGAQNLFEHSRKLGRSLERTCVSTKDPPCCMEKKEDQCLLCDCTLLGDCFSPVTTVELKDGRLLNMEDLRVGDQVRTRDGFESVYSFGHFQKNPGFASLYVQIHTETTSQKRGPIELSSNHLIFVQGEKVPIPASEIKAGHVVLSDHNGPDRVTKVTKVERIGLMHPYTSSGTIIVNGILASNHVVVTAHGVFKQGSTLVWKLFGISSLYHFIGQTYMVPVRFACLHGSLEWCRLSEDQLEDEYFGPMEQLGILTLRFHQTMNWFGKFVLEVIVTLGVIFLAGVYVCGLLLHNPFAVVMACCFVTAGSILKVTEKGATAAAHIRKKSEYNPTKMRGVKGGGDN